MSRPESAGLQPLAERRQLRFPSGGTLRTPLLVPSFSSRVPEIEKVFGASSEFVDGPFLISAYDVARGHLAPPFNFGGPIFLDSGGYEVGSDSDLSDVGSRPSGSPTDWTPEQHQNILDAWQERVPTVVITYDHPKLRQNLSAQVAHAKSLRLPPGDCSLELLIKPETTRNFIDIRSVVDGVRELAPFHVIGVTEKEIGNSVFDRMVNIARLRMGLRRIGLETPIHVFGSLDTITTLFYFVAGADIFDGLTWLRYAFKNGQTVYRQDFGIRELGISTKAPKVEALCWSKNYGYIREMELEMRRFLGGYDFGEFQFNGDLIKNAYRSVEEEVAE